MEVLYCVRYGSLWCAAAFSIHAVPVPDPPRLCDAAADSVQLAWTVSRSMQEAALQTGDVALDEAGAPGGVRAASNSARSCRNPAANVATDRHADASGHAHPCLAAAPPVAQSLQLA